IGAVLPLLVDTKTVTQYEGMKDPDFRTPSFLDPRLALAFAGERGRAAEAAAAVGQGLGAAGTKGPAALAALADLPAGAAVRQDKEWLPLPLMLTTGPASPLLTAAAVAAYSGSREEFLPLDQVKDRVAEKERNDFAQ